MLIKDKTTGKMREETDEEKAAREAAEAAEGGEGEGDEKDEKDTPEALRRDRDHWKAESRKWEGRAKENKAAADELKTLKQSQLTDQQKADAARQEAEKAANDSKIEAARLRVAIRKGLNETQAKRLVGTTEEELEADADELLKTFTPAKGKTTEEDEEADDTHETRETTRSPRETLRPRSGTGKTKEVPFDAKAVVDKVYERTL